VTFWSNIVADRTDANGDLLQSRLGLHAGEGKI
jgi:hypothetical protein